MSHILLTSNVALLARWIESFAGASVYESFSEFEKMISGDDIVWIHLPDDPESAKLLIDESVKRCSNARLVALSNTPDDDQALKLMEHGVHGYCHALASPQVFSQISAVVSNQGLWVGPALLSRLIGGLGAGSTKPAEAPSELDLLSAREKEVAILVGDGASNKVIARQLDITERTVKAHVSSIFQKLGLRDRLQLALVVRDASI